MSSIDRAPVDALPPVRLRSEPGPLDDAPLDFREAWAELQSSAASLDDPAALLAEARWHLARYRFFRNRLRELTGA